MYQSTRPGEFTDFLSVLSKLVTCQTLVFAKINPKFWLFAISNFSSNALGIIAWHITICDVKYTLHVWRVDPSLANNINLKNLLKRRWRFKPIF